jgi:hypothetical protein
MMPKGINAPRGSFCVGRAMVMDPGHVRLSAFWASLPGRNGGVEHKSGKTTATNFLLDTCQDYFIIILDVDAHNQPP